MVIPARPSISASPGVTIRSLKFATWKTVCRSVAGSAVSATTKMPTMWMRRAIFVGILVVGGTSAFHPSLRQPLHRPRTSSTSQDVLWMTGSSDDHKDQVPGTGNNPSEGSEFNKKSFNFRMVTRRGRLAVGLALSTVVGWRATLPVAYASAPVMALPKAEGRDPASEALGEMERAKVKQKQAELNEMAQKAREIERTQGEGARRKYEQQVKETQAQRAVDQKKAVIELKRQLLDQGIDPFTDLEGQRQVVLMEKGVDLGEVQGTRFNLEKEWERRNPKKSMKVQKEANRQMIALMVQDLKNRDMDPLEYFEKHQDQTETIMALPAIQAASLVEKYRANLEEYGQIVAPKEGEISAKEKMALRDKSDPNMKKKQKEIARQKKAEEKARLREEKARLQAQAKATKEQAKAEKARAKAQAKAAKEQAKTLTASESSTSDALDNDALVEEDSVDIELPIPQEIATSVSSQSTTKLPMAPAAAAVVTLGGGGIYAFTQYQNKQKRAEEERQRQFRLLMGDSDKKTPKTVDLDDDIVDLDEEDDVYDDEDVAAAVKDEDDDIIEEAKPVPKLEPEAPKKRAGIKGMFGKKKSARETDIRKLVSKDAEAPELASVLAKLLTFGAPGRFPRIEALPGGMPMSKFELESAKELLNEVREESDLSMVESAEVFANVVNCMLIDIVDLASTSLKEKDEKITIQAINIVVDFMDHAASLYEAVAGDVVITPVTYGGSLGKGKLETMYTTYAVSGMMNMGEMTDDFDNRVGLLQDVFQISEKKAEGLMMKAVQKNMMKMLKDGKGAEGMEDMLKGMGGMEGMEGLLGGEDGEGPSPEQLKEMLLALKEMKDSGSIPDSELEQVKSQFREAFGSSIDDVVKDAKDGELSSDDKELLELMKSILD